MNSYETWLFNINYNINTYFNKREFNYLKGVNEIKVYNIVFTPFNQIYKFDYNSRSDKVN